MGYDFIRVALREGGIPLPAVLVLAACGATKQAAPLSPIPSFTISVGGPVTTLHKTAESVWTEVVATIANHGDAPLYMVGCYAFAQRRIAEQWVTVWNENCLSHVIDSIGPGDSVVRRVNIGGSLRATDAIKADRRLTEGTYRVGFYLSSKKANRPLPQLADVPPEAARVSPPFEVRGP